MRDWLLAEGFDSPALHWYVDYACRDDYGTDNAEVSAWAGIHYFACRDGERNTRVRTVLTGPEGNAWLARGLAQRDCGPRLHTGALVHRLADRRTIMEIDICLPR